MFLLVGIGIAAGLLAAGATMWKIRRTSSEGEMPMWFGDKLIAMHFSLLCDERFAEVMPATGDVLVAMLWPDCGHCREVAAHWELLEGGQPDALNVIGVSVAEGRWTVMLNEVSSTQISADDELAISWEDTDESFIAAPTFITVRDLAIVAVATGDCGSGLIDTDGWGRTLFGFADE